MATQEHIDILQQSVEAWNTWRKQHPDICPDLRGATLSQADLHGANLRGADLHSADLYETDLVNAELGKTNLMGADLYHADLSQADLSYAKLILADFGAADLVGANLSQADLSYANFSDTNLSGANLSGADLGGVNLRNANLSGTDLGGAILIETILGNVDLRTVKGLETVEHGGPSTLGIDALERSQGDIPEVFLRGIGLSDMFIEYARALVQKPIEYYTCFISYSSKDEVFAKRLYNDLQGEGVRCWLDKEDMDTGDKIKHRIDEAIRRFDKLLLILSKHSIASTWVAYEVERALNKEPAGEQNVLYPVRLDKAILTCEEEWAKDIEQTRHITSFERWKTNNDTYRDSFKRLLRSLKPKETTKKTGK